MRKLAAPFTLRKAQQVAAAGNSSTLPLVPKPLARRPDPIILLSPSASSLLRISNIRAFLEEGNYVPPDSSSSSSSSSATMLNVQRIIPSLDPVRPTRFIIVDTPEQFRPEYWSRVVAVFTTGQAWQFKSYKWQQPQELFKHSPGIYVGWRGDTLPGPIKAWGRGVMSTQVDKWVPSQPSSSRWRDREVVESIWKAIEVGMMSKGWKKDSVPIVV